MNVCCKCVLSRRGLCDELITRPEESYRVWVCLSVIINPDNEEALAYWGLLHHGKKEIVYVGYMRRGH